MFHAAHTMKAIFGLICLGALTQPAQAVTNIDSCRTITQSGSFRVVNNLTANGDCLVIRASHVSIDLQGHTLRGNGAGEGVTAGDQTPRNGIEVRNGIITNFVDGVRLPLVTGAVVERVRAVSNTNNGILVGGGSAVSASIASNNGGRGIVSFNTDSPDDGGLITDNIAVDNRFEGILSFNGVTIRGNSVRANGSSGIQADCPSAVIGNTVTGNGVPNLRLLGTGCVNSQNASVD